ncbi:DUF441 domain-containing protein [Metallumcola ferriviriculae]|uniref:UPF0756 membrane protein MFMK1_000422 n=1 Tax=Metallumcola ferriviriculae TaxID=3039180 RepID=A0AAU0UN65_9FIRM|nr:DUF441 domain-containing protein [Desulfitibacteraceae bacterium MK1]
MPQINWIIILVLILGILGKSDIIAAAAAILLVIDYVNLERFLPTLERRGLELGLLFLVISVLVPFAANKVDGRVILNSFFSLPGLLALIGGAVATSLNGQGLHMLQQRPELMIALVFGSILGIIFLKGIPVGPLMAGGIAALLMRLLGQWP